MLAGLVSICFAFIIIDFSVANAQGFQVSHGRREFVASPNQEVRSAINIRNSSDQSGTYEVVFKDFIGPDGDRAGYATDEIGTVERSMKQWVFFSPSTFEVGPGEERTVNYTIEVPDDQSLTGTYFGAFIVSAVEDEAGIENLIGGSDVDKPQIGISIEFEYAILTYITIAGTQQPDATFSKITIDSINGGHEATAIIENTGNILLRPDYWIEISDVTGQIIYKTEPINQAVLPNCNNTFTFPLAPANLGPGEYLIMVIADYGVPQMIAAQARVTITEAMAEEAAAAEAEAAAEEARIAAEKAAQAEADSGEAEGGNEGGDSEGETGGAGEGEPEAA